LFTPPPPPNLTLLDSNTHVAGLEIHGTPGSIIPLLFGNAAGISAPGPIDNVVIEQTSIFDTGFAGISFGADNSNVRIFDTTIANGGSLGGIFFGIDNRDITISDVNVTDTFGSGIFLGTAARHVSISDATIARISAGSGIGIGDADDVQISNVLISDIANVGILGSGNNNNIKISNSTISDTGSDGIRFGSNNSNVTIADTTIANSGNNGILFGNLNNNVTIASTTVTMPRSMAFSSVTTTATSPSPARRLPMCSTVSRSLVATTMSPFKPRSAIQSRKALSSASSTVTWPLLTRRSSTRMEP
jgi:hypothetical protein